MRNQPAGKKPTQNAPPKKLATKTTRKKKTPARPGKFEKCLTGIEGFDEITEGGIPKNRITLLAGSIGTVKNRRASIFESTGRSNTTDPASSCRSKMPKMNAINTCRLSILIYMNWLNKKIVIDYVLLDRRDLQEAGEFNVEGLFICLEPGIDEIGAKRVVMGFIESLFAGVSDAGILRLEIKRLFRWLRDKQVTALITGELRQGS